MPREPLDWRRIEVVDPDMAAVLRKKTPAEKIAMVGAAHRTARMLIEASVRRQHPEWDATTIAREVARRLLRGTT
jgi:hypothetical protein